MYRGATTQSLSLLSAWADYLKGIGRQVETLEYKGDTDQKHSTIYLRAKGEGKEIVGVALSDSELRDLREFVSTLSKLVQTQSNKKVELHVMVPDIEYEMRITRLRAEARDLLVHIDAVWEFKTESQASSDRSSKSN